MRKAAPKILLVLIGIICALCVSEILARGFYPDIVPLDSKWYPDAIPNAHYHWLGFPGLVHEFTADGKFNSIGFNDVEHSFTKPKGIYRIVIIGDSFVEAFQVSQKQNFGRLLEKMIPNSEVILLGRGGQGTKSNLAKLKNIGLQYHPDLVINMFCYNDVSDEYEPLKALRARYDHFQRTFISSLCYRPENYESEFRIMTLAMKPIMRRKFMAASMNAQLDLRIPFVYRIFLTNYSQEWIDGWRVALSDTEQERQLSEAVGAKFMVASVADLLRITNPRNKLDQWPGANTLQWDFNRPEEIMGEWAKEKGIIYIPLQPEFKRRFDQTKQIPLFVADGHWNEIGHQWAADALRPNIISQ